MKRIPVLLGCIALFCVSSFSMIAQSIPPEKSEINTKNYEDEEGPIIFKFEPNYLSSIEKRRMEMSQTRRIIDTLDISESKRKKLLKDLYKKGHTKRLTKALIADNKFETVEQ